MSLEIERKFLVKSELFKPKSKPFKIKQGFISDDPERSVRIRIKDNKGFITIKGISDQKGLSRYEFEKEITKDEAEDLMKLCKNSIIEKLRYEISFGEYIYEIDVFQNENSGLLIAEIELTDINDIFEKPIWLGKEVTGNKKYYNLNLSKTPFKQWNLKT